jgi:predicted permease
MFWTIIRDNIIPIFLAIGAGFLATKLLKLDILTLSRVTFYVFSPCLVFDSLTHTRLQANEIGLVAFVAVLGMLINGALAWLVARLLKLERSMTVALMLVTMFVNAGNYGLSLNELAFGQEALARALIYFIISVAMIYSIGVFVTSTGRSSLLEAFVQVMKVPALYAVVAAFVVIWLNIPIPNPIATPIALLGDASIPAMLVVLGAQMAQVQRLERLPLVGMASVFRLVVGAGVILGLVTLFNIDGPARQALVIEASTPTAVLTTVLAVEYELEPAFVTSTVVISTLLSPLTLTPLIMLVQ